MGKRLAIIAGMIIVLIFIAILFISPITKYLIEKYDVKYTGRRIEIGWCYANPFTGYVYLDNLKLYELKSDSIFFSTQGLTIRVSILKLFSKTYEIGELTLDHPRAVIIQNRKKFNFDNLLDKFRSSEPGYRKEPQHFSVLNISINVGEFYYREESIPVNYFIKDLNFTSNGIRWNVDTTTASLSFRPGYSGGSVNGNYTLNVKTLDYKFSAIAKKLDLQIIEQYLRDLSGYGSFSANLDADIKAEGNLNDKEDITCKGIIAMHDFHFGKDPGEDYASFEKLSMRIRELSPKKKIYYCDSISLQHPYFKYERYDRLDNLQNMFGKSGANIKAAKTDPEKFNLIIEITDYLKAIVKGIFKSDYKLDYIAIDNADLRFNDYSVNEEFSVSLSPFNIRADSIDRSRKRVRVSLKSGIKPYGNISADISINPNDSLDYDIQYHLEKIPAPLFNPYTISYTSFPLDRGTIEFKGYWNVKRGIVQSNNHLLIIDPRISKRIRNKDTKWMPVPLILSFIRDRGNVIDYQIPIKGDLNNPKFKMQDVILDLVENIFVKPPSTPYILKVENAETKIERSLRLKWNMRQDKLRPEQEKFINRMVEFLVKHPEATMDIYQEEYAVKEKEYILLFEAKKRYFLLKNGKTFRSLDREDSLQVDKMSAKDSLFVRFLNERFKDSLLFTIQAQCMEFIGESLVNEEFRRLIKERRENFVSYFKQRNVANQLEVHASVSVIPYNGFSFYKIEYNGELPEDLMKAYRELDELDDEAPRRKFKRERRKTKSELYGIAQKAK